MSRTGLARLEAIPAALEREFAAEQERQRQETDRRIREFLKDRPDLIAEYDAKMKEIRG